jgi:hypothetical protein
LQGQTLERFVHRRGALAAERRRDDPQLRGHSALGVPRERAPERGADEALAPGSRQRDDGALEAQLGELFGLALARPEVGAPGQALGLTAPDGPR